MRWHIKPVRRDQAGAPLVDIRSKVTGSGHAQSRVGTQFVMPELLLKKQPTKKDQIAALKALQLPGVEETLTLKDIAKLIKLLEGLKMPNTLESMRRNRWHSARRWKTQARSAH